MPCACTWWYRSAGPTRREEMLAKQMDDAEHMRGEAVVKLWIQQNAHAASRGHHYRTRTHDAAFSLRSAAALTHVLYRKSRKKTPSPPKARTATNTCSAGCHRKRVTRSPTPGSSRYAPCCPLIHGRHDHGRYAGRAAAAVPTEPPSPRHGNAAWANNWNMSLDPQPVPPWQERAWAPAACGCGHGPLRWRHQ